MDYDQLHDRMTCRLLRETYLLEDKRDTGMERHLLQFAHELILMIKKNYQQFDPNELDVLNQYMRFNEIVSEMQLISHQWADSGLDIDSRRMKARLITLAEERIMELIEYYAPQMGSFCQEKMTNHLFHQKD